MWKKTIYNLEYRIEKEEKKLLKKDSKLSKSELDELINLVAYYHKNQFMHVPKELYKTNDKDLVDLAREDQKLLIEIFDNNNLYNLLDRHKNYAKEKFKNEDNFRRKVLELSLYEIIEQNGKGKGSEYGLLFAKIFNFDIALPMSYASYDGIFDPKFVKFYSTYLDLNGSKNIYLFPNYYSGDPKSKYNMEDLSELDLRYKSYLNKYKVNSKI